MLSSTINDLIKETVSKRVFVRLNAEFMHELAKLYSSIVIAGNSLNTDTPHDIDVYSDGSKKFDLVMLKDMFDQMDSSYRVSIKSETKNALTVSVSGQIYQFCTYTKNSLSELVESFDYAHVQIGARVEIGTNDPLYVSDVYCTDKYIASLVTGVSEYTKSEYPLSSMLRSFKYRKYEQLTSRAWKESVVKSLTDVILRGFENYADFKDQLDAIDLGLVKDVNGDLARNLYDACVYRNLVKDPSDSSDDDEDSEE